MIRGTKAPAATGTSPVNRAENRFTSREARVMVGLDASDVEDAVPELVLVRVAGVALDTPPGEVGSLPGEEKSPAEVAGPWPPDDAPPEVAGPWPPVEAPPEVAGP